MHDQSSPKGSPDYAVGFGRPPTATQFKPGKSGNPRGRTKAQKTIGVVLQEALSRPMDVQENGIKRRVRPWNLIIGRIIRDAARGAPSALKLLLTLVRDYGGSAEREIDSASLAAEDRELLEEYLTKLGSAKATRPTGQNERASGHSDADGPAPPLSNQDVE